MTLTRHRIRRNYGCAAVCSAIFLSACASPGPAPIAEIAIAETLEGAVWDEGQTPVVPDWWRSFDDPLLSERVEQALSHNRTVAAASANVRRAQAVLGRSQLDQSFSASSSADATYDDFPRSDGNVSAGATLSADWELDAFDRIGAQIRAAAFDLESAKEARRDAAVIVASETALAHIDLNGAQARLAVARQNAELQREGLNLLQVLEENGQVTQLDLERARSQYHTTLASIPTFEAQITNALARLTALTGDVSLVSAENIATALSGTGEIPPLAGAFPAGASVQSLERHPTIRQAQARVANRISLGDAQGPGYSPAVSFSSNLFVSVSETNDYSLTDALGISIGPVLSWEGPDLRRVYSDIDIADADSEAAIALYEQTLLDVFTDVEDALWAYEKELQRRGDLVIAAESARIAADLARLRFEQGIDDFLDVIDAQRTLLSAEDQLTASQISAARKAVTAYRVLGGIWSSDELDLLNMPNSGPE